MIHGNAPRRRSPFHALGLALLMALAIAGLSQCRQVSEQVAGVDLSSDSGSLHNRSACTIRCNVRFRDQLAQENARHEEEIKKCDGDRKCRVEERVRHRQVVAKLRAERQACKRECYNEGSGSTAR